MNRKDRRAQHAKHLDRPTLDVTCLSCKLIVARLIAPRTEAQRAALNEHVARAFRQHYRVTGCVRIEDIEPFSLPGGAAHVPPQPVPETQAPSEDAPMAVGGVGDSEAPRGSNQEGASAEGSQAA